MIKGCSIDKDPKKPRTINLKILNGETWLVRIPQEEELLPQPPPPPNLPLHVKKNVWAQLEKSEFGSEATVSKSTLEKKKAKRSFGRQEMEDGY